MKFSGRQADGLFLVLLAGLFFWFPFYLKQIGVAHHKILVATEKLSEGVFDKTVVLILQHNGYSAFGFILNKPPQSIDERNFGGPVNPDAYYTLHSFDVSESNTIQIPDLQISYTEGEVFVKSTSSVSKEHHIIFKGSSGWGRGQLSREINDERWKVIDFDHDLVFHTDPQKMWDIAMKRLAVRKTSLWKQSPKKNLSSSDTLL